MTVDKPEGTNSPTLPEADAGEPTTIRPSAAATETETANIPRVDDERDGAGGHRRRVYAYIVSIGILAAATGLLITSILDRASAVSEVEDIEEAVATETAELQFDRLAVDDIQALRTRFTISAERALDASSRVRTLVADIETKHRELLAAFAAQDETRRQALTDELTTQDAQLNELLVEVNNAYGELLAAEEDFQALDTDR